MILLRTNYKESYNEGGFFELKYKKGMRLMVNFDSEEHVLDYLNKNEIESDELCLKAIKLIRGYVSK